MSNQSTLRDPEELPPAGKLVLIEINGALHLARRTSHLSIKDQAHVYMLASGTARVGKFAWTYPSDNS